jgi:hypothetical protein
MVVESQETTGILATGFVLFADATVTMSGAEPAGR